MRRDREGREVARRKPRRNCLYKEAFLRMSFVLLRALRGLFSYLAGLPCSVSASAGPLAALISLASFSMSAGIGVGLPSAPAVAKRIAYRRAGTFAAFWKFLKLGLLMPIQ